MKILVLGGTVFLGRHFVDVALQHGHEVTLFHRGQHNPHIFAQAETIQGDRTGSLDELRGRSWDIVIDTSGYVPRVVAASAQLLAPNTASYLFVSSISVYADLALPGADEESPVGTLEDPTVEEVTGETYGPLKALCEDEVRKAYGARALVIRPGLIVGPYDPTDRFTYWPVRIAAGGEVLAPGRPERQIQWIDARDLAAWMLHLAERQVTGTFHVTGPEEPMTMGALLAASTIETQSGATLTWVDDQFMLAAGLAPWQEVPLWIPESDESSQGLMSIWIARARRAGLVCRPVSDTIRDTIAWARTRPASYQWRAGPSPEREQQVLQQWHAHNLTS